MLFSSFVASLVSVVRFSLFKLLNIQDLQIYNFFISVSRNSRKLTSIEGWKKSNKAGEAANWSQRVRRKFFKDKNF